MKKTGKKFLMLMLAFVMLFVSAAPAFAEESTVTITSPSKIIVAKRSKFNKTTYRGEISDTEMMELIINTIKERPTVNKMQLKEFGIV